MDVLVMQQKRSRYIPVFIVLISVISILIINAFLFRDTLYKTQGTALVTSAQIVLTNTKHTETVITPDSPYPPDSTTEGNPYPPDSMMPDSPYPPDRTTAGNPYPPDGAHSTL